MTGSSEADAAALTMVELEEGACGVEVVMGPELVALPSDGRTWSKGRDALRLRAKVGEEPDEVATDGEEVGEEVCEKAEEVAADDEEVCEELKVSAVLAKTLVLTD